MHYQEMGFLFGIIGAFVTIFSIWYRINQDTDNKIHSISRTFSENLAKAIEQGDEKRSRIYERLDQVKESFKSDSDILRKEVMDGFVPLKICTLVHSNSEKTISELKGIIMNIDKKVDKLSEKVFANHDA